MGPVSVPTASEVVTSLVERSRRLGADAAMTNYAGGNTSAKGAGTDPVTGDDVRLMWVKGSGGDLGTLTASGLAVLRLDRLRALVDVYPGVDREDEMVQAFDHCLHGNGGAAPSIDTAMHGLVEAEHVDHLHPDAGIALATAADGEALTKECFGGQVVWVPWRRPGFQLGLDIARIQRENPQAVGCVLGGHGITTWGDTSAECEQRSIDVVRRAGRFLAERGRPEPLGPVRPGYEPLPPLLRHARAAELAPVLRGLASTDALGLEKPGAVTASAGRPLVGHYDDSPVVLDFLSRSSLERLAALGTSCPDHFLRTKVRPLVLDLPASAGPQDAVTRLRELHAQYRLDYRAYYDRHATAGTPAMRGCDPAIVLVPGVGMFSFGADAQTARVAGEYYINAINAMRGAEAVSTYAPIDESEKFRIEYWALEEAKLARRPRPRPLTGRVALVTGGGSGIGRATARRLAAEGACVVIADRDEQAARDAVDDIAAAAGAANASDVAVAAAIDVTVRADAAQAVATGARAFGGVDIVVNNAGLSLSKPVLDTTEDDWDRQHDVMTKGSFLVSQAATELMLAQGFGGDIVYVVSKNAVFAGPENVAYGTAKAGQAHQVRLLAAELGQHGIRVNGVNPDGVVRGSGIFAGGWGAKRAAVYGVDEADLGAFYAQRTLLRREVLPEHVAAAVFVLVGGDLGCTTGVHIPVDAGVAAAFLR